MKRVNNTRWSPFLLLLLLSLMASACFDDDDFTSPSDPKQSDCQQDSSDYDPVPFRAANHRIDEKYVFRDTSCISPTSACDLIEVPDTFYLIDRARNFLPQSKLSIGEKISYVNNKGAFLHFEIVEKDHAISKSYFTNPCVTGQGDGYCFFGERYQLRMNSHDCKYQLKIRNNVFVRLDSLGNFRQLDGMAIFDETYRNGNTGIFYLPLYDNARIEAEYYPSYSLNGDEFAEVYKMEQYDKMKVFYNQEYGLVGFIDEENVEWKIYK
ncbi:MAG: hypothetical protein AAFV95_17900 [Bacteroidota bacterium]